MKKWILILPLIVILILIIFQFADQSYSNWQIKNNFESKPAISWVKFEWTSDTLSGRTFEKSAMIIPCKIKGIPNVVTFQFDLGSDLTGVYENTYNSLFAFNRLPKIKRLKSQLQFWTSDKYLENFELHFGAYTTINKTAYVFDNYGEKIKKYNVNDTIHLGTIGRDLFKNSVLIIDYQNKRFAICENAPTEYRSTLIDIELDRTGRVLLPMKFKKKSYKITFDTGSSIFPIITEKKNISKFSNSPDIDTITISSWGKKHDVTGKMITDTFQLAGQKFSFVKIYVNHSGLGIDKQTDGMAGNALFWNKMVIIDFKNKKFGVR